MKNKGLALTGLTVLLASTLVACSSGSDTSKKSDAVDKTVKVKKKASTYFKDNKLVTKDYDIDITQT